VDLQPFLPFANVFHPLQNEILENRHTQSIRQYPKLGESLVFCLSFFIIILISILELKNNEVLSIEALHQESERSICRIFKVIGLGLSLDEVAVQCGAQDFGMSTSDFLMDEKVRSFSLFANDECDQGGGSTKTSANYDVLQDYSALLVPLLPSEDGNNLRETDILFLLLLDSLHHL
jgi:hypothetical protein